MKGQTIHDKNGSAYSLRKATAYPAYLFLKPIHRLITTKKNREPEVSGRPRKRTKFTRGWRESPDSRALNTRLTYFYIPLTTLTFWCFALVLGFAVEVSGRQNHRLPTLTTLTCNSVVQS